MPETRHIYDVELRPVLGSTFQPTGFPDLGAATFERIGDDGEVEQSLLVESVQSMANRLEAVGWDRGAQSPTGPVAALPHVRVVRSGTGDFLTSSRQEAHRLASPYIREGTAAGQPFEKTLVERFGLVKDTPLDYARMAGELFRLDPLCLVHGVFFSSKVMLGQPKFPRATSAVIEAHDVRRAASGGRKADHVRHQLDKEESGGGTAEGYGSVPFHRTEWTARRITASFVIDRELLGSYGLPQPDVDLLEAVAQWEIRALLSRGLRLRTACDLEMIGDVSVRRGDPLPDLDYLSDRIESLVPQSSATGVDATTLEWSPKGKG